MKSELSRFTSLILGWCMVGMFLAACSKEKPQEIAILEDELPEEIDYNLHVKPILSDNCFHCHGPDRNSQKAGLDLSNPDNAYGRLLNSRRKRAIVPGDWASSELAYRITAKDPDVMMPPAESNRTISDYEKAILIRWIEQGAKYKTHWAFIKPQEYPVTEFDENLTGRYAGWGVNGVDYFVLKKLLEKDLNPSPEASKETLLRRVTLDLTGLPPSIEEIDDFLNDDSPDAYEKVVDRLLASERYGEKMAVSWMDLSRFADTHGYTVDRYRPMWPWRDWVIQAFNENMPFDQFVTWQLAGDLFPDATPEQRLATGFNRNHAQNMEGGIVNEEFRVEYVADRTNTLGIAFLGITMECARCHDHKFDPISIEDYYSVFSFFNNIEEAGQISWDNALPVPTMLLTDEEKDSIIHFLDREISGAERELARVMANQQDSLQEWMKQKKSDYTFEFTRGMVSRFTLDEFREGLTTDAQNPKIEGVVSDPVVVQGKFGQAFQSNGDDILNLSKTGVFGRGDPFSIGIWIWIPEDLEEGVIFHKGNGDILYNFRGYYLNLRQGKAELMLAHTWPYNCIIRISEEKLPTGEWVHLLMTYDGSSKADGLQLYVNGTKEELHTNQDNLYKDILFTTGGLIGGQQPGLQLGADYRGKGFTRGLMDEIVVYDRELTTLEALSLYQYYESLDSPAIWEKLPESVFTEYYFKRVSKLYQEKWDNLKNARKKKYNYVEGIPEIMVMDEMDKPRTTYVLERGEYHSRGEVVLPNVPESILPFPDSFPPNRLGLARWLFHPDHPLTARVAVNRFWQLYFGRGIHKNLDDFGNQGGFPDNLPILDWLAIQFMKSGWDVKAMQKLMVMSATYRQSSQPDPRASSIDPENIFLSRGPSQRMSAEMLRDGALAASGLLVDRIGGPSVMPYQPEGVWDVVGARYEEGKGEDLYRRSLYTFWRRTVPPPSMSTFDAPSRSYCMVQRQETNTPLQALVLLNDPQFLEASRKLYEGALHRSSVVKNQIIYMFRALTARFPTDKELRILTQLFEQQSEIFKENKEGRWGWVHTGESPYIDGSDPVALAAGTVVANTIMNSDAYVSKR